MTVAYSYPDDSENDPDAELMAMNIATIEERRGRVLLMKLAGATFTTIAKDQKISITTARKDYEIALTSHMRESPDLIVAKHRAIITDVMRANYPKMMEGNKDAAAVILKALDREARLLGLDAPTRVLASVSDVEFLDEAAHLIGRIQKIDPQALKELTRVGPRQPEPLDVETVPMDGEPAGPGDGPAGGQRGAGESSPPVWPADPVAYVDYLPTDPAEPGDPPAPQRADPQGPEPDQAGDAGELPGGADDADDPSDYLDGWSNID